MHAGINDLWLSILQKTGWKMFSENYRNILPTVIVMIISNTHCYHQGGHNLNTLKNYNMLIKNLSV